MEGENQVFALLEKYLMGPMGKIASLRFVRAIMAAGMASIPLVIVGSMFLVLNVLPQTFTFLERSEEHTSELQSRGQLVCRLLLDKKKQLCLSGQHELSCHRWQLTLT